MRRLPTVNDLRVKECYICREEEAYDKPARPPKRWVHPCKCTLIAHEDCLLEWIRASENNPDKPTLSILKCPQCGERYKLESNNPLVLRIMDFGNKILQRSGTVVSILSIGLGIGSVGTGVYLLSAGYGLFAVRHFLGPEMFDLVLGDEVEKWPTGAFVTLPLIPFSLTLSKTQRYRDSLPLVSLMSVWPALARVNGAPDGFGFLTFLGLGSKRTWKLSRFRDIASTRKISSDLLRDAVYSWPPSPFLFNVGLSVVRSYYGRNLRQFRKFVLGDTAEGDGNQDDVVDNFQMELRIDGADDGDDEEEEEEEEANANPARGEVRDRPAEQNAGNNQAGQLRDEHNVQLILDGAEEGPVVIEGGPRAEPARLAVPHDPGNQRQEPAANAPARVENGLLEGRARQGDPPNPDRNQEDRNGAARVRLQMTTTYLGSVVGSALIVPLLSSFAGSILLRLALPKIPNAHQTLDFRGYSTHHPGRLLCRFLGVRPPASAPSYPMMGLYTFPEDMPAGELMRSMILLSCRAALVGTPAWTESDPVWWRNALGLGVFYVAKDMLGIWYHYLSRREIRSRRVKDCAFDGINPKELDLKPELRAVFQNSS